MQTRPTTTARALDAMADNVCGILDLKKQNPQYDAANEINQYLQSIATLDREHQMGGATGNGSIYLSVVLQELMKQDSFKHLTPDQIPHALRKAAEDFDKLAKDEINNENISVATIEKISADPVLQDRLKKLIPNNYEAGSTIGLPAVPQKLRDDEEIKTGSKANPAKATEWEKSFDDPKLKECMASLYQKEPSLNNFDSKVSVAVYSLSSLPTKPSPQQETASVLQTFDETIQTGKVDGKSLSVDGLKELKKLRDIVQSSKILLDGVEADGEKILLAQHKRSPSEIGVSFKKDGNCR